MSECRRRRVQPGLALPAPAPAPAPGFLSVLRLEVLGQLHQHRGDPVEVALRQSVALCIDEPEQQTPAPAPAPAPGFLCAHSRPCQRLSGYRTPFGPPVLPDVYMMVTSESGGGGSRASSSAGSIGASPPEASICSIASAPAVGGAPVARRSVSIHERTVVGAPSAARRTSISVRLHTMDDERRPRRRDRRAVVAGRHGLPQRRVALHHLGDPTPLRERLACGIVEQGSPG